MECAASQCRRRGAAHRAAEPPGPRRRADEVRGRGRACSSGTREYILRWPGAFLPVLRISSRLMAT
eukprot:3670101-Pyramimonas_sp.AAC.1